MLTLADARAELRRPLTFGDDAQIRAIRFLDAVEDCYQELRKNPPCEDCNGDGSVFEFCEACGGDGDDCDECEDGGKAAKCDACNGLGLFIMDWPTAKDDVLRAATQRIREENGIIE